MSNITGLAFTPILLAPLIIKYLEEMEDNGSSKGWSWKPKQEKVELSYYEIGDRCSSASDGKLLRPNHRCIHGRVQLKI